MLTRAGRYSDNYVTPVLKEHELVPDTVYPELHVGWHVDPLASELVQSPTPPFIGAVDASHGFAAHVAAVSVLQSPAPPFVGAKDASHGFTEHVAAVRVPRLQDDVPDTVYPELHVGWHVDPLARELVQSPAPPFVGAADASHGIPCRLYTRT
mmetsp:Transcript_9768/g.44500  ORF Transcript_9768/g.44500 Transcript_9768/m.44500 type:complete len:153 (+) Transcript_9768:96-554(+)